MVIISLETIDILVSMGSRAKKKWKNSDGIQQYLKMQLIEQRKQNEQNNKTTD
jgi:hypothetical protein